MPGTGLTPEVCHVRVYVAPRGGVWQSACRGHVPVVARGRGSQGCGRPQDRSRAPADRDGKRADRCQADRQGLPRGPAHDHQRDRSGAAACNGRRAAAPSRVLAEFGPAGPAGPTATKSNPKHRNPRAFSRRPFPVPPPRRAGHADETCPIRGAGTTCPTCRCSMCRGEGADAED